MTANVKSQSETRTHENFDCEKKEREIPRDVLIEARKRVAEFYKSELPHTSDKHREWVIERFGPIMASREMEQKQVCPEEVASFLADVQRMAAEKILLLETINFSRGHELSEKTYPSTEEVEPLLSWLKPLAETYDLYKKFPDFKSQFLLKFFPFIESLMAIVRSQALASRQTQLLHLLQNQKEMDSVDFEYEHTLTLAHIEALGERREQPLLELRDLLNLSNIPRLKREPTMDEQQAFQFLWKIFNQVEEKRT